MKYYIVLTTFFSNWKKRLNKLRIESIIWTLLLRKNPIFLHNWQNTITKCSLARFQKLTTLHCVIKYIPLPHLQHEWCPVRALNPCTRMNSFSSASIARFYFLIFILAWFYKVSLLSPENITYAILKFQWLITLSSIKKINLGHGGHFLSKKILILFKIFSCKLTYKGL